MLRLRLSLVLLLLGCRPGAPALAQALSDPSALRFAHAVESRRAEVLESSRHEAALRFLSLADGILSLPEGSGHRRTESLGEAQSLADSIALLDQDIAGAAPAAAEARRGLIRALESQVAPLRQAVEDADARRRSALEARIRDLEAELGELREIQDRARTVDPLSAADPTLAALARVVAQEHARLRTLRGLQDELRLFLGGLRLFDETGMPPSVRAEAGGDPDPGGSCGACTLPTPPLDAPADLPLEHFRPESGPEGDGAVARPVTLTSLSRFHGQLAAHTDLHGRPEGELGREDRTVTREIMLGAALMAFRSGADGLSGLGLKAGSSFLFSWGLGNSMQVAVEPWVGGRSVQLDVGSSSEMAGEVRETLTGASPGGRLRWQVTSWQKGRFLSDPLPLPGYLEPGRKEGGLAGRLAVPIHSRWDLEVGGGGDAVRYGPEDWKVLDRQGANGSLGAARRGETGSARLALLGSRHEFPQDGDPRRQDTRMGVGADWSLEGRTVVRLSAGVASNDSRLPAYDFRSGRAAVVISAPWVGGSVQAYGALAHKSYLNPGPEEGRVAPSDQDTGSVLALQLTRSLDASHSLTFRAEWSRSETGFRNDFYQRFGTSVQITFRGLGAT